MTIAEAAVLLHRQFIERYLREESTRNLINTLLYTDIVFNDSEYAMRSLTEGLKQYAVRQFATGIPIEEESLPSILEWYLSQLETRVRPYMPLPTPVLSPNSGTPSPEPLALRAPPPSPEKVLMKRTTSTRDRLWANDRSNDDDDDVDVDSEPVSKSARITSDENNNIVSTEAEESSHTTGVSRP